MDKNDRQAIENLFDKLATVERQSPQRDAELESLHSRQDRATARRSLLHGADHRRSRSRRSLLPKRAWRSSKSNAAEARPANGGFFDSLFGDRREPQRSSGSVPRTGTATREPMQGQHPGGGGFLAGAAQTALGVTGGVLLGNAIAGMLGGREAKAAEPAADKGGDDKDAEDKGAEQPQDDDAHTEEAVYEVGGDDFGDFDMDI